MFKLMFDFLLPYFVVTVVLKDMLSLIRMWTKHQFAKKSFAEISSYQAKLTKHYQHFAALVVIIAISFIGNKFAGGYYLLINAYFIYKIGLDVIAFLHQRYFA